MDLLLESLEAERLAPVDLVVLFEAFRLVGAHKTLVNLVVAQEDFACVLLHIVYLLYLELKIVLRALIQITRLANDHLRHAIGDVLLPTVKAHERDVGCQAQAMDEFD